MDSADLTLRDYVEHVVAAVRHTYIRATQDQAIPLPLQDRMINKADSLTPDNTFDVYSIDASHSGITLHVTEIADILTGCAGQA